MYNVDMERIERQLNYLEKCLRVLEQVRPTNGEEEQLVDEFAAVRALHVAIECVTDIGNALIDGFIMRDPGSYEDIVEIMKDEAILPDEEADEIKQLVGYRRKVVVYYTDVTQEDVQKMMAHAQALKSFPEHIRTYLDRELPR